MPFKIERTAQAEEDAWKAAEWYEEQEPGLGDQFILALEKTVLRLVSEAGLYAPRRNGLRRLAIERFPKCGIFYRLSGDDVRITAIFHGARHPRRLRGR
jgi:plasmid stabilization system protein ParE